MSHAIPVPEVRELPEDIGRALWQLHSMQQPANWPFPPLAPMQARNHAKCVAELDALAHRRRQQALRECLRAWQEQVGEALL